MLLNSSGADCVVLLLIQYNNNNNHKMLSMSSIFRSKRANILSFIPSDIWLSLCVLFLFCSFERFICILLYILCCCCCFFCVCSFLFCFILLSFISFRDSFNLDLCMRAFALCLWNGGTQRTMKHTANMHRMPERETDWTLKESRARTHRRTNTRKRVPRHTESERLLQ